MTSQAVEGAWIRSGGYGRFRGEWVKELLIHAHCKWLAESINKSVERITVRKALSPLSGLICEIVNSFGRGKFYICQVKVREFQKKPLAVATMIHLSSTMSKSFN